MTNTEMWLDEIISHIQSVKSDMWMLREIISLPNCNDCKNKDCEYKPKWGEHIRYNCPLHLAEADRKTENSSEKPNNCEHITEDGVTCVKYPACDDCLDNPLNKVKGSERLLKGKDEPQTCSVNGRPYTDCCNCEHFKCTADEPQTERSE